VGDPESICARCKILGRRQIAEVDPTGHAVEGRVDANQSFRLAANDPYRVSPDRDPPRVDWKPDRSGDAPRRGIDANQCLMLTVADPDRPTTHRDAGWPAADLDRVHEGVACGIDYRDRIAGQSRQLRLSFVPPASMEHRDGDTTCADEHCCRSRCEHLQGSCSAPRASGDPVFMLWGGDERFMRGFRSGRWRLEKGPIERLRLR
jgi:hypothetical protein